MPPARVGPYRVESRLGSGGLGEVFLAEDTRLKRRVALKSLSDRRASEPSARQHLLHEARAAARLNHPNIAAVYDVLEEGQTAYIVMEYVPGRTLAEHIENGPLTTQQALEIGLQLCHALVEAHAHGILHRDLKPANLIQKPDGRLKVLDFGLAKALALGSGTSLDTSPLDLSRNGKMIVGTPAYVPPERYLGESATEREDIYATGVVLYELLTGARPFAGSDIRDLAAAILKGDAVPAHTRRPGVPVPVSDVVARAMARRPVDRHPTAASLRHDLERLQAGDLLGTTATLPGRTRASAAGPRRFKRHVRVAAAAVLALMAAFALLWVRPAARERPTAHPVPAVLVLPLANATGDASNEALGTGVADVLISSLSRVPRVNVLSLAAGQQCARGRDARCGVREFGADYVLDGSVQRQAARLRITLSLVSSGSSLVAWSDSYEGTFDELFALQHEAAEGVAGALRVRFPQDAGGLGLGPRLELSERAFGDYSEALRCLERRDEPASLDRAIALLENVTRGYPTFALAYAALGRARWAKYEESRDVTHAPLAQAALDRALELDPGEPGVLLARGMVLKGKGLLDEAEHSTRRALAAQPDNDEAHAQLGTLLAARGDLDAGFVELRRAIELRPGYWQHHQALAAAAYRRGDFAAAAASSRQVIALRPESASGYVNLGSALYNLGDRAGARQNFEAALRLEPDADAYSNVGFLAFEDGRYEDAATAFRHAVELLPADAGLHRNLADALVKLGKTDEARAAYAEAAHRQRERWQAQPKDGGVLARLALYEAKAGDLHGAKAHAARALELAPQAAEVAYFASVAVLLSGDEDAALRLATRAIGLGYGEELVRNDDDLRPLRPRLESAQNAKQRHPP